MKPTVRLGRLSGIDVGAHWSALATAALLAYMLADVVLPDSVPGRSGSVYWAAGLVGAAGFLLTLLAHELSHALVAKRRGMRVTGVVLWLLGGVTTLDGEPPDARTELAVAAAGPATSLGAAGLLGALALLADQRGWAAVLLVTLEWLALSNLLIGLFNLLPGAPLDGGRIVRAAIWLRTGNQLAGTRAATRAGGVIGAGLIVLGMLEFFFLLDVGGMWLALVGFFVRQASTLEGRAAELAAALGGTTVGEVMRTDVVVAPAWQSVEHFLHGSAPRGQARYPVVDLDGAPVGAIVVRALAAIPAARRAEVTLGEVCVPLARLATAAPGDRLAEVLTRYPGSASILVIGGGRLAGMLDERDIAWAVARGPAAHPASG